MIKPIWPENAILKSSKAAIKREKQLYGKVVCLVCGFDFEATYGAHGKDFIEGHHSYPSLSPGIVG
ncbi:hypothetical protein [Ammoniphilus sp. 3BR4]|uniref:hypothetical protein n=1 Tax=Ammoniphilus sp. 3BR4 TaxID=3158265 RepID=UPI0034675060